MAGDLPAAAAAAEISAVIGPCLTCSCGRLLLALPRRPTVIGDTMIAKRAHVSNPPACCDSPPLVFLLQQPAGEQKGSLLSFQMSVAPAVKRPAGKTVVHVVPWDLCPW